MPEAIRVVNSCGISPVRKEATDRSEMVTQFLLGESAEVLDMTDRWLLIRMDLDGYEGWVNRNEVRFMPSPEWENWSQTSRFRNAYASMIVQGKPRAVFVPLGAVLGRQTDGHSIPGVMLEPVIPEMPASTTPIDFARSMLGTPYLWGGRTDVGVDCSGLVQMAFLLCNRQMPRDAWQQHALGFHRPGGMAQAQPGDLLYFGSEGRITHVGFYEGNGTLLHAQGFVKQENLLHEHRFNNPFPLHSALFEKLLAVQDGTSVLRSLPEIRN